MYKKNSEGWLKHIDFVLIDMICLQAALVLAYAASGYGFNPYGIMLYRNMALFIELVDLITIILFETMKNVLKRGYYKEFVISLKHTLIVLSLTMVYLFLFQMGLLYSRKVIVFTFVFYFVLTYIVRISWRQLLKRNIDSVGNGKSLLIIAPANEVTNVVRSMKVHNYGNYIFDGVVVTDEDWTGKTVEGLKVVSSQENAPMYVCQEWIDEVMVITTENMYYPTELISQLIETGVTVHLNVTKIVNEPGKKQFIGRLGEYTVLTTTMNCVSSFQLALKRLMDIGVGLVGCICTGIIFLFVGPMIYFASPGPIFFSQERVGKNGKRFKIYKFRSMYMDAEERKAELMKDNKLGDGKMFKLDFDPRVIGNRILPDGTQKTGVGDFIRRTSLDEFPQFYNVLRGDMSVVGTRPPLPSETSLYELHHRARLAIKPGITGMWQVSGRSDITDFEEVVRLDKEYINNWNIGMDIKILLKTVMVVFQKDGSM